MCDATWSVCVCAVCDDNILDGSTACVVVHSQNGVGQDSAPHHHGRSLVGEVVQ